MSKELKALNYVWYNYYTEELNQDEVEQIEKNLNIVQDGLKRLESIDNANSNKALECLENHKNMMIENNGDFIAFECLKIYSVCKQALLKAQEQEKVLEILKEKPLSLLVFKTFKIYDKDGVLEIDYQYFVDCHKAISEELDEEAQEQVATKEEFELLKRYCNES